MKKQIILGGLLAFSSIANAQWTGTGTTGNITRTGNVGIGSAVTPVDKLHVTTSVLNGGITVDQTTTGASALTLKNSTAGGRTFMLASSGINNTQGAGNFDLFDFGVGGTGAGVSRLFIQGSTGYIGIGGTSSPQNNLHINTSVLNGGITIDQTTTGASAITLKNSTTGGRTFMLASSGINNTQGAGNFDLFDFGVGGTGAGVSRLFIQGSTGNVGLGGMSNPATNIDIITSTAVDNGITIKQVGTGGLGLYFKHLPGGLGTQKDWSLLSSYNKFKLNTNNATHLDVDYATGNMGIGLPSGTFKMEMLTQPNSVDDGLKITNQSGSGDPALFLNNIKASSKNWSIKSLSGGSAGFLSFRNETNGVDGMKISSTGNVEIGAPISGKLSVNNPAGSGNSQGIRIVSEQNSSCFGIQCDANGVSSTGIAVGIRANALTAQTNYGGYFAGYGSSAGITSYGVYAEVLNPTLGGTNYGIYASVGGHGTGGASVLNPNYKAGYFNGDVFTTSSIYWSSDKRLKKDITKISNSLNIINKLNPVSYNFDTKSNPSIALSGEKQYGFISQEVKEILPELTNATIHPAKLDEKGNEVYPQKEILGVNYIGFIALLTKGIQEQQVSINDLTNTVATQQKQLDEQKELINTLLTKTGNTTGVNQLNSGAEGFALDQNIPNPFSQETVIKYTLTQQTKTAVLNVYDLSGKQITSFPLTERGASSITVSSEKLAAGIYIYSVIADGKIMDSKRMVVAQK